MSAFDNKYVIPDAVPVLPLNGMVVFPYRIFPLSVGKASSIEAVREAYAKGRLLFLVAKKEDGGSDLGSGLDLDSEPGKPIQLDSDEPVGTDQLYKVGVLGAIMRFREFPDGQIKILVQGLFRAKVKDYTQVSPFHMAAIERCATQQVAASDRIRIETLANIIKRDLKELSEISNIVPSDLLFALESVSDLEKLVDIIASNLAVPVPLAQATLEMDSLYEQMESLKEFISLSLIRARSQAASTQSVPTSNPFFTPSDHGSMDEIQEFKAKMREGSFPEEVHKEVEKQILRLEKMHPESNESSVIRNYIDWILQLPWEVSTQDSIDLKKAKEFLDREHYGLKEVKDRILEFLAVQKLNDNSSKPHVSGQILCFVGPPGVGKTSLGKSIATAMGRKYERIALGGTKDETEIRGHRRTYVGSMPGKIIQALKRAGSNNPVLVLDEIDKLSSSDFKGDPASAFLEVLDSEQNAHFRDNYINLDFDLRKVLFVATANYLEGIPHALRDRLEMIHIPSYILDDKIEICKRHLIPRIVENHGLNLDQFKLEDTALEFLITHYTKEAGVRSISREIAALCRKVARNIVMKEKTQPKVIDLKQVQDFLGKERFIGTDALKENHVGIVNGLAWTQCGGELLVVEAMKIKGKGGQFVLTGKLGDVMKESAQAALSYAKANRDELNIPAKWFSSYDIHLHFPSGAISKDGPSAGITIGTVLVSLMTGRAVRSDVAMTGEVTLTGRVLQLEAFETRCWQLIIKAFTQ